MAEQGTAQGTQQQNSQHLGQVLGGELFLGLPQPPQPLALPGRLVRDDIEVQVGRQLIEPVHQVFGGGEAPLPGAPAQNHLGDTTDPGVLRDLYRRVIPIGRGNAGAQLLGQVDMIPQAFPVLLRLGGKVRRLHKQCCKRPVKGLGHPGRGADDLGVGGRAGQADQNMLPRLGLHLPLKPGGALQLVRGAPEGNLPEGGQIFQAEKMIQGLGRLGPPIDFPLPEAFQQVRRLQVHHLHLVGRVKHIVGHPLGHGNARDGGHHVVEALQMLDVHRGVHIDPRPQQLLDVLIPLGVAAAGGGGVGQLIHQQQLGVAGQGTVQVKLLQGDALVRHGFGGQDLQPLQQRHGLRPGVGLNIAGHHVNPRLLGTVGGLQHGVGLPHAGGIAKKDF